MSELLVPLHLQYIALLNHQTDYEYHLSEYLRLNGIYWGLNATCLLNAPTTLDHAGIVEFVLSCYNLDGGFGAHPDHDSHLHTTLSAVQCLVIVDALDRLPDADATTEYILSLRQSDGSFAGDIYGEIDTRFVYTAVQALHLLGRLTPEIGDLAAAWIAQCANFDGGYGLVPGAESHAAQVWTCLGTLAITNHLELVDVDLTASWLSERQVAGGGFNGRPEKLPDVCYLWWVLLLLAILNKIHWIDGEQLKLFILSAQDPVRGGISDRPGNEVDVFHLVFGLAGLSLLGHEGLAPVSPVFCLPASVVDRLSLRS